MSNKNELKKGRKPTLLEATLCFIILILVIVFTFRLKIGMEMPLVFGVTIASLFGIYLGYSWDELQKGIVAGINTSIMAIIILLLAGMLVGIWIIGGTVPSIIYYGLKMVTPSIFLPFTFLLCSITSVATGTSFGCIATVGLALSGVGQGLGIPAHITAGAIASGAFFGDKISPLSDTTVISAAICDVNIFEHIQSTVWTTIPASIISFFIYAIIGSKYSSGGSDIASISVITETLATNFNISYLTFIPPVAIIVMSFLKVPSVVALGSGVGISIITSMLTQNLKIGSILSSAVKGNVSETGVQLVDKILSRGGMSMMTSMIVIFIIGTAMSGALDKCEVLTTMMDGLLKIIKKPRDLIITSLFAGYLSQIIAPTMTFGIVFVGKTFTPAYKKLNIHPKVLTRTIGDTVTLGNVLIPYGGAAVYLMGVLGLENASYIPYTFVSILSPIIAIFFACTGIGIFNYNSNENKSKTKIQHNV